MFGISRRKFGTPLTYTLLCLILFLLALTFLFPSIDRRSFPSWAQLRETKETVLWDRSRKRPRRVTTAEFLLDKKRRLPNFIIAGSKKCGTGALRTMLPNHSLLKSSRKFEVNYFDKLYDQGIDYYMSVMPWTTDYELGFEKSTHYFDTPEVPKRIYDLMPDVKFVITLKDPLERFISDSLQTFLGPQSKRDQDALEGKDPLKEVFKDHKNIIIDESNEVIDGGIYFKHLSRWLKYFPLSQFHFVDGEAYIKKPWIELEKLENFLGVPNELTEDRFFYNATKNFYCLQDEEFTGGQFCSSDSKGREHPTLPLELHRRLVKFYRPWNELFFKLIGKRFDWAAV